MSAERKDKRRDEDDPRLEYIYSYVLTTLRLKYEKWQKMITTEDLKLIVLDWLNNPQRRILLLNLNSAGLLVPALSFPANARGKSAYFVKKYSMAVTTDNFRKEIILGDLPSNTVKSLAVLFDEVFFPLVNCPLNRELWPEIVSQDVAAQMKDIRNILTEVKGNISKRTVLSVTMEPHMILEVAEQIQRGELPNLDGNFENALEGMVINWTTQIHSVINEAPEIFKINYMPVDEVSFWNARFSNLHNIYLQIRSSCIKSVVEILESINSVYAKTFNSVLKNLIIAIHEAQDISLWISPILKRTNGLSEVSFTNCRILIKPLVHIIYLIWTKSRYYCIKKRIVRLIKAVSNLLLLRASEDLNLVMLFHNEADEGALKISNTIEVIEYFKMQINEYSTRPVLSETETFNREPWNFHSEDVFNNLDKFLGQMYDLREIFDAAMCFQNLERMEIGGSRGKYFTDQTQQAYKEFREIFQRWTTVKIDLINSAAKVENFKKEKIKFFKNSEIIEKKLGSILIKAFEVCYTPEQCMKLIQMTSTFLNRPAIERDIKSSLQKIFELSENELKKIEHIFHAATDRYLKFGTDGITRENNFPLVAGAIMWIKKLQSRASNILQENSFINYQDIDAEQSSRIIERRNFIMKGLTDLQNEIWTNWTNEIGERLERDLDMLAIKKEPNSLKINFGQEISSVLREAKCLTAMKISGIPENIMNLYALSDSFWKRRTSLSRIEEWYNSIQSKCSACELLLINDEIIELDKLLLKASTKFTWKNFDEQLILQIFDAIKDLYSRITEAHNNVNLIMEKIRSWSHEPLYKRSLLGKRLLDIENKKKKYMNRVFQCLDTKRWINRLMVKNFCLYFNYSNMAPENSGDISNVLLGDTKPLEDSDKEYPLEGYPKEQLILFRDYREYVDTLITKEIRKAVKIRFDIKTKNN